MSYLQIKGKKGIIGSISIELYSLMSQARAAAFHIQVNLPPYIVKQPEDYFDYQREQKYRHYVSLGFLNFCEQKIDPDKRYRYTILVHQYIPKTDPKYYRQSFEYLGELGPLPHEKDTNGK